MIDEELMRLRSRLEDLNLRVIPDFQNRTELLFARIMPMPKDSEERKRLEEEYTLLNKELTRRSDELIGVRHEIQNLEMEKNLSSR